MTEDLGNTIIVRSLDLVGKQFGSYKILGELGRGGVAIVYKADEQSLNRIVALKVLSPKLSEDETTQKRFRREAQTAAQLSHPNIVHIYTIGEEDGVDYFTMEYVKGRTLKEIRDADGVQSVEQMLPLMIQVADALREAHKAGLVHRDIKPSNIMVDPAGRAKVADFGIARVLQANTQLTSNGQFLGTPQYMSPEQCEGEEVDGRSDIYSLGVTFYEMLTGHSPYEADTPASILVKITKGELRSIRDVAPSIARPVASAIERMLHVDREKRHRDADELLQALKMVQQQVLGIRTDSSGMLTTMTGELPGTGRRRRVVVGMAIVAVVMLLAAVVIAMIRELMKPADEEQAAGVATADATPTKESTFDEEGEESQKVAIADKAMPESVVGEGARSRTKELRSRPRPAFVSGEAVSAPVSVRGSVAGAARRPVRTRPGRAGTEPKRMPRAVNRPKPADNTVVVITKGDSAAVGAVAAYARSAFGNKDYAVVGTPTSGKRKIADVAAYRLGVTVDKMGSTPLIYMGTSSDLHTVLITMQMVRPASGRIVAGPLSRTVNYTALTAEDELKTAVSKLASELQKSLK